MGRAGVPRAKAFFDDVTIPGLVAKWQECWEHTKAVLRELTSAGLMINLRKCKFLVPKAVVLGY